MEKLQLDNTEYSDANTRKDRPNEQHNEVDPQSELLVPSSRPSSTTSRKLSSSSTSSSITRDFLKLNIQNGDNSQSGANVAANEQSLITTDDDSDGADGGVRLDAVAPGDNDGSKISVLSPASTTKVSPASQTGQPSNTTNKKKRTRNKNKQSNTPMGGNNQHSADNSFLGDIRQGVGIKKATSHKGGEIDQSIRMVTTSIPSSPASPSPGRKGYKPSSQAPPVPTPEYLAAASAPVTFLNAPVDKSILVILDLNGTLLFRNRQNALNVAKASANPDLRPHLSPFLDYIFKNCQVMIWSSATPKNVTRMMQACFTKEQQSKLVACWGRDTLGLSANDYGTKTVTYKRLDRVFTKIKNPNGPAWDLTNTILIDDSAVKAQSHPHNHIEIPDFDEMLVKRGNDNALAEVAGYLDALRWSSSVATVIQKTPFKIGQGWKAPWLLS